MPNLRLNEALLVINKGNISNPIQVFYQNEECFGCQMAPLRALDEEPADKYVLDTKYSLQLELRASAAFNSSSGSCQMPDLELNSGGQYRVDITRSATHIDQLECTLKTLDFGECLLCPFAILICFLFALVAGEQAYKKFWLERKSSRGGRSGGHENRDGLDSGAECSRPVEGDDLRHMKRLSGSLEIATTTGENRQQQASESKLVAEQSALATTSKTFISAQSSMLNDVPLSSAKQRIECLDVFRGFTLASMIFVNYGGAGYAIWDHKPWDGITLADFVFPFFVFSMGASIAITTPLSVKRKPFKDIFVKISTRSLVLLGLGICLNSKAVDYEQADGLMRLRLTGVLQRFAISYFAVAFMYTIELTLSRWLSAQSLSTVPHLSKLIGLSFEALTAINYTAIYLYVTFFLDYDSTGRCPAGYTGPGGQTADGQWASCTGGAAAWLDRLLLSERHLYNDHEVKQIFKTQVSHDPEGVLGCATSIVLTLIGLQCGKILSSRKQEASGKMLALAKWIVALALCSPLVLAIPINKRLWSLTFVLVTALASFLIMLAFYILIDVYGCRKSLLARLLSSAGKNSLFLYVAHSLVSGLLPWWFPVPDGSSHMQLLFRLTWATLIWLLVTHFMAHKKLFIRI